MFKRELKANFKGFLIWAAILIVLFLAVFLVYPSLVSEENADSLNDMMKMFPEDMLKAFNMDIASIDTAFGWLKTEGFVFVLLITGVYSGILGSSILLKEENDKTIEYLNTLPVTRRQIATKKILCGVFYICSLVIALGIFNFFGLWFSGDFDKKQYLLLSITPIFSSVSIFAICLFISTFTHKTKMVYGISLGIVFASYFLQILSEMSDKTKFFKYFTVFTLADIRNVIKDVAINPIILIIFVVLSVAFCVASVWHYEKKELV